MSMDLEMDIEWLHIYGQQLQKSEERLEQTVKELMVILAEMEKNGIVNKKGSFYSVVKDIKNTDRLLKDNRELLSAVSFVIDEYSQLEKEGMSAFGLIDR